MELEKYDKHIRLRLQYLPDLVHAVEAYWKGGQAERWSQLEKMCHTVDGLNDILKHVEQNGGSLKAPTSKKFGYAESEKKRLMETQWQALQHDEIVKFVAFLPKAHPALWSELCENCKPAHKHHIVPCIAVAMSCRLLQRVDQ